MNFTWEWNFSSQSSPFPQIPWVFQRFPWEGNNPCGKMSKVPQRSPKFPKNPQNSLFSRFPKFPKISQNFPKFPIFPQNFHFHLGSFKQLGRSWWWLPPHVKSMGMQLGATAVKLQEALGREREKGGNFTCVQVNRRDKNTRIFANLTTGSYWAESLVSESGFKSEKFRILSGVTQKRHFSWFLGN